MIDPATNVDQVLKSLAASRSSKGSNVRVAVRDLTLKALNNASSPGSDRKGPPKRRRRGDARCGKARDQGREGAFRYRGRHGRRVTQGGSGEQRCAA